MPYLKRRREVRKLLDDADAMLITNETNVRYLTGFTGDSSYLIVTRGGDQAALLISDPRYEEQIGEQCPGLSTFIRKPSEQLLEVTSHQIRKLDIGKLKFEGAAMTVDMHDQLREDSPVEWIKGSGEVERLREIKDAGEVKKLKKAVEIAQHALLSMREQMRGQQSEHNFAYELEHTIRKIGGEGCSFKPIVAAGPRSALPHAEPGDGQLGEHGFVLVDWGAIYDGYRSDLTRVLLTSRIPAKILKAYETVLAAQTAAIRAMKPGVSVAEVDQAAREVIAQAGMSKRFNHGLGHGIGLNIHEAPRLGQASKRLLPKQQRLASGKLSSADNRSVPPRTLQPGMVVTVEPGVYYPGLGGIRIEDDVLITRDGAELLSSLPRGIEENSVTLLG